LASVIRVTWSSAVVFAEGAGADRVGHPLQAADQVALELDRVAERVGHRREIGRRAIGERGDVAERVGHFLHQPLGAAGVGVAVLGDIAERVDGAQQLAAARRRVLVLEAVGDRGAVASPRVMLVTLFQIGW
jgi:hypothetical protein